LPVSDPGAREEGGRADEDGTPSHSMISLARRRRPSGRRLAQT